LKNDGQIVLRANRELKDDEMLMGCVSHGFSLAAAEQQHEHDEGVFYRVASCEVLSMSAA
jgi:hypothetical protein